MAEPKKRHTSTRSGNRRSHLNIKEQKLGSCPKCHTSIKAHYVCSKCGFYKGNDVLEIERKEREKKERRKAADEANAATEPSATEQKNE